MKLIPILMLSILLGAGVMTPRQANATIVISLDFFGGDCFLVGNWDVATFTCTLTTDITESVVIGADGIILDCDGHSITGSGSFDGINLFGRTGVGIKNCIVTDFSDGIELIDSDGNTLRGNTAKRNLLHGIQLSFDSDDYTLRGNTANDNFGDGIQLIDCHGNTLRGNTANGNNVNGIQLDISNDNTLKRNTANGNVLNGIKLISSDLNNLKRNTANGNGVNITGGDGIDLDDDSDNNILNSNNAFDNGLFGIDDGGFINIFLNNNCDGNGAGGSDPAGLCAPQP